MADEDDAAQVPVAVLAVHLLGEALAVQQTRDLRVLELAPGVHLLLEVLEASPTKIDRLGIERCDDESPELAGSNQDPDES